MAGIEQRLERIETMLEQIMRLMGSVSAPLEPHGINNQAANLIALARRNPADAIAEAKRLSRLETARRRRTKQ